MSANLVSSTTITGNLLVQGQFTNVSTLTTTYLNGPILDMKNKAVITVASGQAFALVVLNDGTVRSFGVNAYGQLGVNDLTQRNTPVQVWAISSSAIAVAGGLRYTAVLLTNGTVKTFGLNNWGQLGVGDNSNRSTPVQVLNISTALTIACGAYHTAVVLTNGTVQTFGRNFEGALGLNDTQYRYTPVQVWAISSSAIAIACGQYHTAVLLANGTVQTFGKNNYGQLGVNDTASRLTPVQVLNITSAIAIACGQYHTAVVLMDGTVRTFGQNTDCQLGLNDTASRLTPVQVWAISSSAIAVACGRSHTAVLLANGTVRTFGQNLYGQLGVNDTTNRSTPVQVLNISTAISIACPSTYINTYAILANGTVQSFGYNGSGQLGVNDTTQRNTPVPVLNISTAANGGINYQASAILLGLSNYTSPYNLDISTDYARKSTTTTWTTGSDERIKNGIETANVERCVEIVQGLDLKYFQWNFPEGTTSPDTHSLGWIAQEFEQFFPNSVETAPAHGISDFKNLNTDQIIKVMWGALRKLRAQLKSNSTNQI